MFVTKKNRIEVYSYLFKEGVLVAKKDFFKEKHDDIDVPNLEVLNLMKSLKSRGFIRETFNWQYYYWYLENEGVEYLREYLHLPAEIVPATLKKTVTRPVTAGGQAAAQRVGTVRELEPGVLECRVGGLDLGLGVLVLRQRLLHDQVVVRVDPRLFAKKLLLVHRGSVGSGSSLALLGLADARQLVLNDFCEGPLFIEAAIDQRIRKRFTTNPTKFVVEIERELTFQKCVLLFLDRRTVVAFAGI